MLRIARKLAERAESRFKHGAVIAKGNRVLGCGICDSTKTHPRWGSGPICSIHAEAAAIRDALSRGIDIARATIYVARHGRCSHISRPCPDCMELIISHNLKAVVYTTADGGHKMEKLR